MSDDFSHKNVHYGWFTSDSVWYKIEGETKRYLLTLDQAKQYWLVPDHDNTPPKGIGDQAQWVKYLNSLKKRAFDVCKNKPGKPIKETYESN